MTTLILQVLGNSDITSGDLDGWKTLIDSDSLEEIQRRTKINFKKFQEEKTDFDFPLIRKLLTTTKGVNSSNALFCFLLTDQTDWQSQRRETGQGWANTVVKDGIWWKDILATWCQRNDDIKQYSVPLKIEPSTQNGTADWEGMAEKIENLFKDLIKFQETTITFHPSEHESIQIEKIIVQHSSGTPALNGALYLWGIERKLTAANLEFVYISKEDWECKTHSGYHWQWHLKAPQIRELLEIQDFSGALQIIKSHPHSTNEIEEKLKELDRAVSLNLTGRPNLTGQEGIIERVAIARWSEEAFRKRSQWMHWYLRVAGAFELVILLLVEKQGNGDYEWKERNLIYKPENLESVGRLGIVKIVCDLLDKGKLKLKKEKNDDPNRFVKLIKIQKDLHPKWSSFKGFYATNWQIKENIKVGGFTNLRNELYHTLLGDRIDSLLEERTKELGSVTDKNHPAQVAVDYLDDIIALAELTDKVEERANKYRKIVQEIGEGL